jgi:hypothetical protein
MAARASQTLRDAVPDQDKRDAYLLGAAALAVAAAVGIAYQRRDWRECVVSLAPICTELTKTAYRNQSCASRHSSACCKPPLTDADFGEDGG